MLAKSTMSMPCFSAYLCGGDFMQGFVMGAITGGERSWFSSVFGNILSGTLAGGTLYINMVRGDMLCHS